MNRRVARLERDRGVGEHEEPPRIARLLFVGAGGGRPANGTIRTFPASLHGPSPADALIARALQRVLDEELDSLITAVRDQEGGTSRKLTPSECTAMTANSAALEAESKQARHRCEA
jgi:hypothetical protein